MCSSDLASLAALRLLLPRQTLRWFASERPLRGRFILTSDFRQYRGVSKGGVPPLCRRGGGVHRGGTPSKGSRPYACFCLLFPRGKSRSGSGGETPGSRQIEWQQFGKRNVSPPPARRYANLSPSVPCAGTAPSKLGVRGRSPRKADEPQSSMLCKK